MAETEELCIAVAKDGAKRAVATRARRRRKALKAAGAPGRLDSEAIPGHRISLIQILVI